MMQKVVFSSKFSFNEMHDASAKCRIETLRWANMLHHTRTSLAWRAKKFSKSNLKTVVDVCISPATARCLSATTALRCVTSRYHDPGTQPAPDQIVT